MAVVLGAFVPDTAAQWRSVVKGEVARQLGVEAEAKKVEARLEKVGAAVRDAEARVARENDAAASRWLARVRAAAYEADVAVDRCRAMARRLMRTREQQNQALPWLLSTCCDVGEPRRDIAADLKNVSQKLKAILKEQRQLQLQSSSVADHDAAHPRKILRHRKSEPTDIDIVGTAMEDDARRLVRRLTQTDGGVAIVGPDGIGKTTLARVVFDSERVKRRFDSRSWVHVSNGCYGEAGKREAALLSQVIEAIDGGAVTRAAETVADMEKTLAGLVANKRFLLMLDEVRNGGEWEELVRRLLEHGRRGSTVLVTALNGNIARDMGASGYVHRVNMLGADDGWALLRVAACVPDGEADDAALKGIGRKIVDKCGGVPLAIKAVAGVLRTREAIAGEWAAVETSPAWTVKGLPDDAMKPFYLCYDDMPCHLKQCFLYCSLFLSDSFAVDRRALVQQWIAEGFVQIRGDAGVEEVAEEYYDELIGRNLLQPAEADRHGCVERCTMHDMLRSMARVLSHGKNLTGDAPRLPNDGDGDASFAPWHVSFPRNHLTAIPDEVLKLEGVRTLLLQRNPLTIESNVFTRLLHLKVLDLTETAMEVIPETLGNLLYLRFLNLSGTRIKALPETIGNLWSLKFLLLRECKALHVLPKGIEHLKGLRDLDLTGTVIKDAAFRVGHLRSLTSLRCFAVASKARATTDRTSAHAVQDRSGWTLDELKNLCQLRTLHVKKLENATSQSEAAEVALHAKTGLRELELSCSVTLKSFQIPTVVRNIEDIFRELKPPRCLELLKIENYFGTKFPTWLSSTYLPNLLRLNITGCNFCQSFLPLGRLMELRSLCIADSLSLKDIDAQFMGTDHSHQVLFPKLEDLHLQGLHNLETWTSIEAGALPSLQALQLESCSKLRRLPDGFRHVTSMTELRIVDMESLEVVENIAALRELSVWNTPNLKKICNLPSLEDLDICHCPLLETVENINRLQEVHIFDHELQEMPRWIEVHASKLCSLEFMSTTELLKRCLVDGPDWSMIKHIRQVHGYSNDSSYIYYSKSPYIFESSVSIQESLDTEETLADSDKVDDASMESRNIDQEDSLVSSSGTSTVEINGFFDTKLVQTGTARSEDNAPDRNMERFMTRSTGGRLPKLEEVPEEDEDEDEEVADSVVPVPADTTKSDTVTEKLCPVVTHDHNGKAGSKVKRDAPTDAKSSPGSSVVKSAGAIGHKLVREGSRAINITETERGLNLNSFQSKGHASSNGKVDASDSAVAKVMEGRHQSTNTNERKHAGRVHDTAKMPTISVEKSVPESTKPVPMKVSKSNENKSPDSLACSRQKISKKKKDVAIDADTLTVANHPSNAITESHPDKVNKIAASVTAIKNDAPIPEHKSGKEESKKSAGVIYNTLNHADSQTIRATETAQDFHSSLLHGEPQLPDVVNNSCISISDSGDQTESSNTSLSPNLNNEDSKANGGAKTTCSSGPRNVTVTLACKQQTADPSDDTDTSIKKMASKISEKVGKTCSAVSSKRPVAETVNKITRSSSLPIDSKSHAIDITAPTKKLETTLINRFSTNAAANDGLTDDKTPVFINVKADDSHQAPKVYSAIWADTDTDTLKARFLSTMQHYRRMASHRRRRHRKHSSRTKWSIWPVLVAVLLIVSALQLLFTFWMYRKLLNQNPKVNDQ